VPHPYLDGCPRRGADDSPAPLAFRSDDDPLARTAVVAVTEELVMREIADHGADQLPKLATVLTQLATRLLTTPAQAH
jgi:hypothetical protein